MLCSGERTSGVLKQMSLSLADSMIISLVGIGFPLEAGLGFALDVSCGWFDLESRALTFLQKNLL